MALNAEVGQQTDLDTTPVAEPETAEEVGTQEDATSEETTETAESPKKGATARVREAVNRAKQAEERVKSLEERLAEVTAPQEYAPQPQQTFNDPIVKPGEEIDASEFERRVLERANASADLKIRQAEAINRINSEAAAVQRLFPELDPESESFNEELSETITEATEHYIRTNPYSASVKTFVTKMMKPYQGAVNKEVGKATENIARQVSQAALRPTSVRQPEKTAAEKTVAELEAELGIVNS